MPKRFSVNTRLWIYRYLIARDGEFCRLCGKAPAKPFTLDIDHIDNDHNNNDPDNLQLAHRKCNQKKEIEYRSKRKKVNNVSLEGSPATRIVRANVDYTLGSPEMKANSYFEVSYRKWIIQEIALKEGVIKKDAINSGAELVGCSPMTISRYTDKLLSEKGPLQEFKDAMGSSLLIFKDEISKVIMNISKPAKKKATKKRGRPPKEKKTKAQAGPGPGSEV